MNPLSAVFGAAVAVRNSLYDREDLCRSQAAKAGGECWQYFCRRKRQDTIS